MKYKITLSEDETFVRLRVFEAVNGKMAREFVGDAIKLARQHRTRRFLVDVRGTLNIASSTEQYSFGHEDMKQFGFHGNSRFAILADANDTSHSFIETVFINAGYRCRTFSDEDVSMKWLGN